MNLSRSQFGLGLLFLFHFYMLDLCQNNRQQVTRDQRLATNINSNKNLINMLSKKVLQTCQSILSCSQWHKYSFTNR
jgi:hypothetical protein